MHAGSSKSGWLQFFAVVMLPGLALNAIAADAAATTATASYGVLAKTVATAGTISAAASALLLCWKGRFPWEPVEQDIPSSAQRFGSLVISILIAIMWYRFTIQGSLKADDLISLAGAFLICGLISLVIYGLLVGVLVYDKTIAAGGQNVIVQKIIGGFWLTSAASKKKKSKHLTVGALFKGAMFDEDVIWPRISRALAKACFQLTYVTLVAGGTCALTAISLLVSSTIT